MTLVVFGATGDLARRKLFPAVFHLVSEGHVATPFRVIGAARRELSDDAFRRLVEEAVEGTFPKEVTFSYVSGDFAGGDLYAKLARSLEGAPERRLLYFATPPQVIPDLVTGLKAAGVAGRGVRVVVEKPFGWDEVSARELNARLHEAFAERDIFRIDHYLGKETVQNILVMRFSNGIMEPLWNRTMIDHVQITVAETVGVEERAGYYEGAGALRDMVQNHLFQLLALVAMEPPNAFSADAVRSEKVKVFHAMRTPDPKGAVRGQYGAGSLNGERVVAYTTEPGVDIASRRETFVAMKLLIDNWRWAGVPFFLRTGKRLPKRSTRISIVFRKPPLGLFQGSAIDNVLSLHIQPDEGLGLDLGAKRPGLGTSVGPVELGFMYQSAFPSASEEAYARLIVDALTGDATLFTREDEVEAAWHVIDPLERAWEKGGEPLTYASGTWGPDAAQSLIAGEGRAWINP